MFNTCQYGKDRTRDNTGTAMVVIASGNNFGSSKSCQDESWNEGNSAAVFFFSLLVAAWIISIGMTIRQIMYIV